MLYLGAYVLTTLATFGILAVLGRGGERDVTLDSVAGLARKRPWLAFSLTVCMFSLLGFPGTFGFIGKWAILSAVTAEHHRLLAIILVLTSLVSAGYYLPVVRSIYMRDPLSEQAHDGSVLPTAAKWVVAVSVVLILVFGVVPELLVTGSEQSAASFAGTGLDRIGH